MKNIKFSVIINIKRFSERSDCVGNVSIEFFHKVRGNFSPNGLQKVFLSFHPADRSQMEQVASEILEIADCAIFYHLTSASVKAKDINIEDYALKLKEMKLFVIVITTNYLTNDSLSKNLEFTFALEHNIPILPIAFESKLEELFAVEMNKIRTGLGAIQLLNRTVSDKTEIPYDQKLARALNAILADQKQINMIKAAFVKRIFLSYRKKDRKYANELMRTIHSVPSLERTSIWYDEFLSSGERWDDQIKEALHNSDVFLLLVTPFITEPDNYVIQKEYPEARSLKKPIISVNKVKNALHAPSMEELKKTFPGLKVFVDGDDASELENVLKEAGNPEKRTLEQDFLVGLAYFNGIDVERDNEKAVSLIIASAKSGLPEAISKLADMYWFGDGVSINYEKSILWRKSLAAIYEDRLLASQSECNLIAYAEALDCLTFCLFELSAFRESLEYGKRLSAILEKNRQNFPVVDHYLARAYDFCGKSSRRLGRMYDAICYTQKYCELSEKQYTSDQTIINLHDLAVSYERMGDAYYDTQELSSAEEWYQKSRRMLEEIHHELRSSQSAYSLSALCLDLGDVYVKAHRYTEAFQQYDQATKLRKQVLDAEKSDAHKKAYGEAVLAMGTTSLYLHDFNCAQRLLFEAKEIMAEQAEKHKTIEAQHAYSVTLNRYARVFETTDCFKEALLCYTESLEIRKKILSKIRTADTVYEYAVTLFYIAITHESIFQLTAAKMEYDEVIELMRPLLSKDEKKTWHYLFAMATFHRFKLDTFSGKTYLQDAMKSMHWLTERCTDNIEYQKTYEQYCKIYKRCYPNQL